MMMAAYTDGDTLVDLVVCVDGGDARAAERVDESLEAGESASGAGLEGDVVAAGRRVESIFNLEKVRSSQDRGAGVEHTDGSERGVGVETRAPSSVKLQNPAGQHLKPAEDETEDSRWR